MKIMDFKVKEFQTEDITFIILGKKKKASKCDFVIM